MPQNGCVFRVSLFPRAFGCSLSEMSAIDYIKFLAEQIMNIPNRTYEFLWLRSTIFALQK